jgi:hypothetical protein
MLARELMKQSIRRATISVLGGVACAAGVVTPAHADESWSLRYRAAVRPSDNERLMQ